MPLNPNFRPSKVEQCVLCPGCLKMCEGIPKTESEYAKEGTMLHDKVAKHDISGLTSEQIIAVERCFELQKRLAPDSVWEHEIPMTVTDDEFNEIICGTADLFALKENGRHGILTDMKFGRGAVTPAPENWQVKTYVCMAFQKYDIDFCDGIIFSPRLGTAGFSTCTYSREDLADFPLLLKNIYENTQNGIQLHAGEKQCKFCDAKPVCPEYASWTGKVSNAVAKIEHSHELSIDRLAEALKQTAQVKDFIKQLQERVASIENVAREKLIKNEVTPEQIGYMLKIRKGNRKCVNPQEVFNILSEVIPIEKFMSVVDISISELETLYGKEAKEKGLFKTQKEAVKDVAEKIAPYIERKSDSYMLEKLTD